MDGLHSVTSRHARMCRCVRDAKNGDEYPQRSSKSREKAECMPQVALEEDQEDAWDGGAYDMITGTGALMEGSCTSLAGR